MKTIFLRNRKKFTFIFGLLFILSLFLLSSNSTPAVKNIIILIPDGFSVSNNTFVRLYLNGQNLSWDEYICGLVKTYSADAPIADSAPAGTAYATGFKSTTGYISVLPDVANMPGETPIKDNEKKAPIATILEAAKIIGKSTGLVATSNIQHATPAVFAAHYPDRGKYEILGEQMLYNNVDVMLGGGYKYFINRKDKENLIEEAFKLGYKIVKTKNELLNAKENKILGLFADDALAYDFDRNAEVEPSLAEMTKKAIEILSKNKNGFFLMVEGSKIDWANHANDPIGVISDVLAFNEAVKVAIEYAKKNKDTVVIVVSDHSTGGFSIGNKDTSGNYDKKTVEDFLNIIKNAKLTGEGLEKILNADMTEQQIREIIANNYGIKDLTQSEIETIIKYLKDKKEDPKKGGRFNYIIGPMISNRAFIGWTTNGHVGEDVFLAIYHPTNIRLTGVVQNKDIGNYMAKIFNVNLVNLTIEHFQDAEKVFTENKLNYSVDKTDSENPVAIVSDGKNTLKIPANKNYAIFNDKVITVKLINVWNSEKFYISKDLIRLFIKNYK
ncbi:MAG: alkaline phosphatase [Spirochaetes bacterium]|nr:alkaline phosphatase [Spirochaetota bacterium]